MQLAGCNVLPLDDVGVVTTLLYLLRLLFLLLLLLLLLLLSIRVVVRVLVPGMPIEDFNESHARTMNHV